LNRLYVGPEEGTGGDEEEGGGGNRRQEGGQRCAVQEVNIKNFLHNSLDSAAIMEGQPQVVFAADSCGGRGR
jgi:hypothetical protein